MEICEASNVQVLIVYFVMGEKGLKGNFVYFLDKRDGSYWVLKKR